MSRDVGSPSSCLTLTSTSGTHDAPHTYQITFNTRGTFTYRCTNHSQLIADLISGMAGIVEVR
jgi:plastocyanin